MSSHAPAAAAEVSSEVIVEQRGRLGLLTLNRPAALNALTHTMVRTIAETLGRWVEDEAIATVAVIGAGERGLCAGGDVVGLYRDVAESDGSGAAAFWRDEYTLNARIASYPKPFVAIQDGLVLGGGIGISAHASHRIVTERSKLGFPEVGIGFVPDVGATWLLSRAPGTLGILLALSAGTVRAADAILVGFADNFVPSQHLGELLVALESLEPDAAIAGFARDPGAGSLASGQPWSDAAFSGSSVVDILRALRDVGTDAATLLAATIDEKSPQALAVTLEALRRARDLPSLEAALESEYRGSVHASQAPDFVEGIRAQLIDKDRTPHWSPASHAEVTDEQVDAYFRTPASGDLVLAARVTPDLGQFHTVSKETP